MTLKASKNQEKRSGSAIAKRAGDARFLEQYGKLNPKQKEAVDTIEGPVMVIAGPGTGKTTVLTLRIANILRKTDTPPSGILAITFTDAGVKAMRQKLHLLMGARADEVRLHTFHGFAASVIAEFQDHFVHLSRAKQMTDIDAESLIREILKGEEFASLRPFGNPDFYVAKIVGAISEAKREALTPEVVCAFAKEEIQRIKADPDSISTRGATRGTLKAEAEKYLEKCERTVFFAAVFEEYEKQKRNERRMDFDDLITELLHALQRDTLLLRLLQEKFLYLLVDEHQDTNDSQNLLVRLLADFFESPNVFVVGDEKQAIYRFQGASVKNFLMFKNAWKDMKTIALRRNYRSHQRLLDGAFSMIENNYAKGEHAHLRVKLVSGGSTPSKPIDIIRGGVGEITLNYMANEIQTILKREKGSTVAVITKTNRDLERVLHFLESRSIPVSSERRINIFSHPIGNLFFTLAEYLADSTKSDALAKTIAAGLWNVPFESGIECIRALRSGRHGIAGKIPALLHLQNKISSDSPMHFLIFASEASGFLELVAKDPASVEVWRGITELAEQLVREGDMHDPRTLLERLLAYKASADERSVKISLGTPEFQLKAMTAHGSKGLEFDYVYLPFATEESWTLKTRGTYFTLPWIRKDEGDDIRDARRLFYVALTRARKHAVLLVPEFEAGGREQTALRFLSELDPRCVRTVSLSASDSPFVKGRGPLAVRDLNPPSRRLGTSFRKGGRSHDRKILDLGKTTLLTRGLSVTALNHFLACPSQFLYQSILKIPQAPSASAEKGTAVHEAFAHIWQEKDRSTAHIEQVFKSSISAYFRRSLLPAFEKDAIVTELHKKARAIAKELQSHFSGTAITEVWTEGTFTGQYAGKSISIPIHGKLDALQERDEKVWVYDYKTKETMSVAAIKGEITSASGDYFRQLIFYKILLQENSRWKNKTIIPSLVFVIPDKKGKCGSVSLPVSARDIGALKGKIQSLVDSVWSGHFLREYCDEPGCEWCKLKKVSALI